MRSIFINGLRGELQAEIKSLELDSLVEIKNRALMLEERNKEWKGGGVAPMERGGGFFTRQLTHKEEQWEKPLGATKKIVD